MASISQSGTGISTSRGAVAEGDTRSYRVNFGGMAPPAPWMRTTR